MKVFLLLLIISCIYTLDNGLGQTPPMGWNSLNLFGCRINETVIKEQVDAMVDSGLLAAGYNYMNLDDCWEDDDRDYDLEIIEDKVKFPNGLKQLGKYIHSKGMKFGLYSDAGYETCLGKPGSLGYEKLDANSIAFWGADYLKYDNCYTDGTDAKERYPVMRDTLNATGRPIFYAMCDWGESQPAIWADAVANSWRTTKDMRDNFITMMEVIDENDQYYQYSGPGGWNDPDTLHVGFGGMTTEEYRIHMALWSLAKAPLIIGCDVTRMTQEVKDILMNPEVIAVNQDELGIQGHKVKNSVCGLRERKRIVPKFLKVIERKVKSKITDPNVCPNAGKEGMDVWAGKLKGDAYAVIVLNRSKEKEDEISFTLQEIGMTASKVKVRDLWERKDLEPASDKMTIKLKPRTHVFYKLTPQ